MTQSTEPDETHGPKPSQAPSKKSPSKGIKKALSSVGRAVATLFGRGRKTCSPDDHPNIYPLF